MRIIINDGDLFEGTFEQFQDCFFHAIDEDDIKDRCDAHGYNMNIEGEMSENTNTNNWW